MVTLNETRKSLPTTEIVTRTGRLSPFEDLKKRTLSAIAGLWPKLLYVTELRSKDGRYEHWGHSRVHGDLNSQVALAQAHSELYLQVLRTPLRDLSSEWEHEIVEPSRRSDVLKLMVPTDLQGGSPRHFSLIVLTARLLSEERRASTRSSA